MVDLKGKKFKYLSKITGLSSWIGTIDQVELDFKYVPGGFRPCIRVSAEGGCCYYNIDEILLEPFIVMETLPQNYDR